MKHLFKIFLMTFLLMGYAQANAGVAAYCDVLAAADDGSKKSDGKQEEGEEEEEPDCD